jgi:DNA polymerase-1
MAAVYDDLRDGRLFDVCHPLLQIHDELLFECREDVADDVAELVKERFESCVELAIPITAGAAKAATWGAVPK